MTEIEPGKPSGAGVFETAADPDALDRAVAAATPVVVERADLGMVNSLEPALREPMFRLLSSLADNKYMLGRRYAEWCTGAPMLESAVAAAAMAQDELGHARSFYPLLRGFPRGLDAAPMEERGWQHRPTMAMTCLSGPFGSWSDFVAANLLVDTALTTLLEAALSSPYEPLRQRARKIQQEESGHWVHAAGWLRRLGSTDSGISEALGRVWDDAFTWFGQANDPVLHPLATAALLSQPPDQLRSRLQARVEPLLPQDTAPSLLARRLPWPRWDPNTRTLHAATA
ncbi:MAG: phenylacetate-CoA oxygenase subunit PaaI [Chloroflexota bacterium]|nr:phenylacetate-CoA oxygenase subunit PaaI [Chloroflexota bacterium]